MKYILCLIMSVALCCALVCGLAPSASAESTAGQLGENLTWRLEDGTLTISGSGDMPDGPGGWWQDRWNIRQIVIEPGVSSIGSNAFQECTNLKQVSIPQTVLHIGNHAFEYCRNLPEIEIPESVVSIGDGCFLSCESLSSVRLPSTLQVLGASAFKACQRISEIVIPEGIVSLNASSFSGCTSLVSVRLPASLHEIGSSVFAGCRFKEIELPEGLTRIGPSAFSNCSSLKEIRLPSGIETLEDNLFSRCEALTGVELPLHLKEIGENVFFECSALKQIELPDGLTRIGPSAFYRCSSLKSVRFPSGLETIEARAFIYCSSLERLELPPQMHQLGESVFFQCTALMQADIPEGVTSLPNDAFRECTSLRQVTLPASLKKIGECAFAKCSALTEITLPDSLEEVCRDAFALTDLKQVDLPASVKSVPENAFCPLNYSYSLRVTVRNPDCEFAGYAKLLCDTSLYGFPFGGSPTMVGYYGSTAYAYAMQNDLAFEPLDGCALGYHAFTDVRISKEPSCTAEGERLYTCVFCGLTNTEVIEKLDHQDVLTQQLQAPTWFASGRGVYVCLTCGRSLEAEIPRLSPGDNFQQVLYDRSDWSGAYLLCGFFFEQNYDGTYRPTFAVPLCEDPNAAGLFPLGERFGIYNVDKLGSPSSKYYTYIFEKQPDDCYTIRSYETGKYLAHNGTALISAERESENAKWNVFVQNGRIMISCANAPDYYLLYNDLEKAFQLLSTYTYNGTTYTAADIFGLWLFEPDPCVPFVDVNPLAWYHPGIDFAVSNRLFNGVSSNRFDVDGAMTRAMFVTVLWRIEGKPAAKEASAFSDVPANTWYSDAVAWASSQGIVKGTSETTFSPDASITREQMAVLMFRYTKWLQLDVGAGAPLAAFPDAGRVSDYAEEALGWATARGIINGNASGGSVILDPQGKATRAQVATILMRFAIAYFSP